MSTDASDSRGSLCSGTPIVIKKKSEKPPFNLYFCKHQPVGRSNCRASKLDGVIKFIEKYIAPKFYSRDTDAEELNLNHLREIIEKNKIESSKNHSNRNCIPLLSSQSYGWWYDGRVNSKDTRFNFHKSTSDMVRSNIMIQWEDQKLQSLHN